MDAELDHFSSTGTDVSDDFLNIFTGKSYSSFELFATDMNSFMALSRTSYKKAKTLYFPEGSAERHSIVYRAMKLECQREGCPAFLTVGTRRGFLRVGKYFMVHSHQPEEYPAQFSLPNRSSGRILSEEEDSGCVVNNSAEFAKWFAEGSFATFREFKHTLDLFSAETGSEFKVRNSVLFPPETPESQTLVYKVISLKCIHGGSYISVASKVRPSKTKCMGCMANITAKAKDGCLVVARARLRHNHALFSCSSVVHSEQKYSPDFQANQHFKYEEDDDEEEEDADLGDRDPALVNRMEVADTIFQRLRARALSKHDPRWFSGFIDILGDVDRITENPRFPSGSREQLLAVRWDRSLRSSAGENKNHIKKGRSSLFVAKKRAADEDGDRSAEDGQGEEEEFAD